MTDVISERLEGGVARITINRPAAANALSRAARTQFAEALAKADADQGVGAIIVTGAGDRAFSAGLDLRELGHDANALAEVSTDNPRLNPTAALDICKTPVIGAINGVCVTGALELALACDILIAADTARFADTHVKVGLLPVWGLSQRLSRVIGPGRARELSLSCRFIDARTAELWGLVNRVVPATALADEALALGKAIAVNDAVAVTANKALMRDGFALPLREALTRERDVGAAFNARVTPAMLEERRKMLTGR
jgi:enoyl-CoA hydratase